MILVTGSSGHLGEALMRTLRGAGRKVVGFDVKPSSFTDVVGSIGDRELVRRHMEGVRAVLHTATLHKPHVGTHTRQDFIDTNVTGTLSLLEEATAAGAQAFVLTSTTSTFGSALTPGPGEPAAWVTEDVSPVPKNIYGVTKVAAEDLCELFFRDQGLPAIVLRTSRFFPEEDDNAAVRARFSTDNAQANELLYRRVDLADVVSAHLLAMEKAEAVGFARLIISATTPFTRDMLTDLRGSARQVVERLFPRARSLYAARKWEMFDDIDRVYVNDRARSMLGWRPDYDFARVIEALEQGGEIRSELARAVGSKGYHEMSFGQGPYPVGR